MRGDRMPLADSLVHLDQRHQRTDCAIDVVANVAILNPAR